MANSVFHFFYWSAAMTYSVLGSSPRRADVYHQGCAYAVLQFVERPRECSAVYGLCKLYILMSLKSFDKNPIIGLQSVAILWWLWRKWRRNKAVPNNPEPFTPSRCIKASFYILENRLNFPTTRGFRMYFQWNWFTNTRSLQVIFTHYKSRIAVVIRGL